MVRPILSSGRTRRITSLMLGAISLSLILMSILGNWFSIEIQSSHSGDGLVIRENYGLVGALFEGPHGSEFMLYLDMGRSSDRVELLVPIFYITLILSIAVCSFTLVFCLFVLSSIRREPSRRRKRLGNLAGYVGTILSVTAVIYFALALPSAMRTYGVRSSGFDYLGFWGNDSVGFVSASWGPGWAWYLMIISLLLSLASVLLFTLSFERKSGDIPSD